MLIEMKMQVSEINDQLNEICYRSRLFVNRPIIQRKHTQKKTFSSFIFLFCPRFISVEGCQQLLFMCFLNSDFVFFKHECQIANNKILIILDFDLNKFVT
jgi:hypothetical protein